MSRHPQGSRICACGHPALDHQWTHVDERCNLCDCDGWSKPRDEFATALADAIARHIEWAFDNAQDIARYIVASELVIPASAISAVLDEHWGDHTGYVVLHADVLRNLIPGTPKEKR